MFVKFKNHFDGHKAGDLAFIDDVTSARRLLELAVAELPSYAEIETEVMRNKKMQKTYSNKAVQSPSTKRKGRPPGSRNKPRARQTA